jgi:serine/threonine-protein kinase
VYAATHRNGLRGALKLLNADLRHHLEARERFFHEGLVASRVKHPGIVKVLDDDVAEDHTPFFVMELLDGETIDDVLEREKRLSPERVFEIGLALLDVLAAAHEAGFVHRDIKPQNLFLTTDGMLKLLDFGIARAPMDDDERCAKTRFGVTMGTPGYMPPEQAGGNWARVGPRSDVWAVGATLFRLLTGAPVHEARSAEKLIRLAVLMPALPVHAREPSAPQWLADVIDTALSFEPEDRYENAAAMRTALERAAALSVDGSEPTLRFRAEDRTVIPTLLSSGMIARGRARGMTQKQSRTNPLVRSWRIPRGKKLLSAAAVLTGILAGMAGTTAAIAHGRTVVLADDEVAPLAAAVAAAAAPAEAPRSTPVHEEEARCVVPVEDVASLPEVHEPAPVHPTRAHVPAAQIRPAAGVRRIVDEEAVYRSRR